MTEVAGSGHKACTPTPTPTLGSQEIWVQFLLLALEVHSFSGLSATTLQIRVISKGPPALPSKTV